MMSSRITTPQSQTVAMNSLAAKMKAAGKRVYNLSAGEPVLPLHPLIREELCQYLADRTASYAPSLGLPELRERAAHWMNTTHATRTTPDEIVITPGGKFGIYALARTFLGMGDHVLVVAPYWVSYADIPALVGASVGIIETREETGWNVSVDDLDRAYTPCTKLLFLNNACNPTGAVATREKLGDILAWAAAHNVMVICDEVYSGLVYDGEFVSCGSFSDYRDWVIVIQSVSKHFAMTGWRVGWVAGPQRMMADLVPLLSNSATCTSTVSQWAAMSALAHADVVMPWVAREMRVRRDVLGGLLRDMTQRDIPLPPSALYFFLPLALFGAEGMPSAQWCLDLLEKTGVAAVPGSAFGKEGYVRFAFGQIEEELYGAVAALGEFIAVSNH